MTEPEISPAVALELHRQHIQNVLASILKVVSAMPAGIERLCTALDAYWESEYARRGVRRLVTQAAEYGELQKEISAVGKPFAISLQLELQAAGWDKATQKAKKFFDEAHAVTLEELETGRKSPRRARLLSAIRRGSRPGVNESDGHAVRRCPSRGRNSPDQTGA